ncbi:PREDICTED: tripartite motif-containing protein 2-like [Amphimedon queenslandica]|uniref:RING-type domain-containing protein n=1 Tax=Amphimedon queenslandica TaxID=400682 RepID=A0AAN0IQJ9_AMPQE|nr:PREDICTED: tripartite motif-containing protein 2-like [Amphimedon queenslandica]|eukprot:XP_011407401.1 PREDICTED: tripartite motif-containing protein 2-like [Amphimedon queenslandica]
MAENTSPAITMTCEVCSEYYTDPLMLPCLHSFCKKCLIKAKDKQGSADTSLKCPTSDTSVNLPDGKIEGLTQNLWLAQQVKEASIKDKMSKKESTLCEQCSDDIAVTFCYECWLFLCNFCKTAHKRIKLKHKSTQTECIYEGETARKALKESVASCDGVIPPVTEAIANGEKMLEQIATHKEEARQEIKETFEELKAVLDKRCNDLLMETEKIASAKRNSVEKQLDGFRKLVKQVSHGRHLASSVSERTDPGEVLSVKKLITNQLEECIEKYKKLPLEIKENEAIVTCLDISPLSKEISKFGSFFEFEQLEPSLYSIDNGLAIPLATLRKERKFKVSLPAGIDKAASYLKDSFIKSDGSKEEERVDIVNDNNTAIVSCTPQSIGGYELSVTIRGQHIKGSPYQLSVKASRDYTTLTNQRSFTVENYTTGVAVHTNGEVFASSTDGFVQVFSADSTAVRRIGSKGNGNGQLRCPWGLLLLGDRLYVFDVNLHRVQYFSATTGQYIGQFGSEGNGNGQFSYPRGMSTDGKGNILVADDGNKRVQVFKEDGTFLQVIQCDVFSPDGKTHLHTYNNPYSGSGYLQGIAIDDDGHILVLTYKGNSQSCVYAESPDGKLVSGLNNPYGIALDKDGCIYAANKNRIVKIFK